MLEEDVKDNYHARFHTHSYQCCRETHFNSRHFKILKKSRTRFTRVEISPVPEINENLICRNLGYLVHKNKNFSHLTYFTARSNFVS